MLVRTRDQFLHEAPRTPRYGVPRRRRMERNAAEGALEEGESARAVATARARVCW